MLHAVCSVQAPKSVRCAGTERDLDVSGKGEGAEERWEKSRSVRMRGGEKQRGNGLTVGKRSWERKERCRRAHLHKRKELEFLF